MVPAAYVCARPGDRWVQLDVTLRMLKCWRTRRRPQAGLPAWARRGMRCARAVLPLAGEIRVGGAVGWRWCGTARSEVQEYGTASRTGITSLMFTGVGVRHWLLPLVGWSGPVRVARGSGVLGNGSGCARFAFGEGLALVKSGKGSNADPRQSRPQGRLPLVTGPAGDDVNARAERY